MIRPVILCGGSGTRLWPLSRSTYPKQFVSFNKNATLFKDTVARVQAVPGTSEPIVVCNTNHKYYAQANLKEENVKATVLVEPEPKNTAPAIAAAALIALESDPDAILLVLPSDHQISPVDKFAKLVSEAVKTADEGFLVTFGIVPTSAETGFGYIEKGAPLPGGGFLVKNFTEKPNIEVAKSFLEGQNHLWNSGIFLLKAAVFIDELEKYSPQILTAVKKAVANKKESKSFLNLSKEDFKNCPSDSIDYAVMEKTAKAAVFPLSVDWNDLGSWSAFYATADKDERGNAVKGDVICQDSDNCYLHSTNRLIAAVGVNGLSVIETKDSVLVCPLERSQDVKAVVQKLTAEKRSESTLPPVVYRPWGSYESLANGNRFQVKRIIVAPGEQLSLQLHYHRAEHWIVVQGTAEVQIGEKSTLLTENQSTYIPLGTVHRLRNPGKMPLILIEVQSGSYVGEDDIVRFEDKYERC